MSEDLERKTLERVAMFVHEKRLHGPATILLEMYRPLVTLCYSAGVVSGPLLYPFIGIDRTQQLIEILKKPENLDALIEMITELEDGKQAA
jgi:hypothetical protein